MQKELRLLYVLDSDAPPVNDIADIIAVRVFSAEQDAWNHAPYGTGYNPQMPAHAPTGMDHVFQHDRYNRSE